MILETYVQFLPFCTNHLLGPCNTMSGVGDFSSHFSNDENIAQRAHGFFKALEMVHAEARTRTCEHAITVPHLQAQCTGQAREVSN